jgi:hypothetical protein
MEKWRESQLAETADRLAKRIVSKKVPEGEDVVEFRRAQIEASVTNGIEWTESEKLLKLMNEQVANLMNADVSLEEGASRFEIAPPHGRKKEKKEVGRFSQFEKEKNSSTSKIYERASEMAFATTRKELPIDVVQFEEEVRQLTSELQKNYPFLFDPNTEEPLTAIQPGYIHPYDLNEKEQIVNKGLGKVTVRYRKELMKLEEYILGGIKRRLKKAMLKGLSNPIKLGAKVSKDILQHEGTVLYLPELYHGFSPRLAQEHFEKSFQEDFRLCEPLHGLMIAYQNLENLDRDPMLSQRIQAYHLLRNGRGRQEEIFGMIVAPFDIGLVRIPYNAASPDVSSGLIFDPKS